MGQFPVLSLKHFVPMVMAQHCCWLQHLNSVHPRAATQVEVYGVDCDQNCYATYESTAGGPGSMTPGILGPEATQCREVSPTGECAELDPIASTRLTVSTWGVDH